MGEKTAVLIDRQTESGFCRTHWDIHDVALLDDSEIIEKILRHLNLWTDSVPDKTRASPEAVAQNITYEPLYDDFQLDPEELAAGR